MKKQQLRVLLRNFLIELVVYGVLVFAYAVVVLQLLGEPLAQLFHHNLLIYALIALVLIVAQGTLLDAVTSFLLDLLPLGRLE